MAKEHSEAIKKYEGASYPVKVVRTAPMFAEKQRNFTELIPHPLIPRISVMWAFLESYMKKTADVFRIYPETTTILEQRIADLKGAFKLQAEGKTVDADLVGTFHIMVNYLVKYSLVSEPLTIDQREELFNNLQRVRAQLSNAHGTTPAVIAVDKTDRYVADLMFMLAESVTKAISDMSDKSWIECNSVLVSVLNVYRNRLGKLLDGFHVFINSSELGGATTPSFHAHAMSQRRDSAMNALPNENPMDSTIVTKQHFERLGQKTLDGNYIVETLQELALENFLALTESLQSGIETLAVERLNDPGYIDEDEFKRFLKSLAIVSEKIMGAEKYSFDDFLEDMQKRRVLFLFEKYSVLLSDDSPKKSLSERQRAMEFCRLMKDIKVRLRYWHRHANKVAISPASEIFACAIMKKLIDRGIVEKIRETIATGVPDELSIHFEVIDYYSFSGTESVVPAFSFISDPQVWSMYGKPIMKIAEESLNSQWEKIYYLTEACVQISGDASTESEILQKLDDLIGISDVLTVMSRQGITFEPTPDSILYSYGTDGSKDIVGTTRNYLRYFVRCFGFARKKKILLLPGLCPRATIIEIKEHEGALKQAVYISPIGVYTAVTDLKRFERIFGPIGLLREANARFEIIGEGDERFVIQKTGGECRTKGRPIFHRDKREHLRSHPRMYEEPIVEAISETIKKYVLTPENLGDIGVLYFQFYMRDFLNTEYASNTAFAWKTVAEILHHCNPVIYNVEETENIESIILEGLSKSSQHAKMETDKAYKLIKVIRDARNNAIKKMLTVQHRSDKLKRQIEEGDFMANYESVMKALERCKNDANFNALLQSLDLPQNERTKEHILYIFGIRLTERREHLKQEKQRVRLIRDNLRTVSYFKLAGLIVNASLGQVRAEIKERFSKSEDSEALLRDLNNSEYLIVELISRIIYKYVGESTKRCSDYAESLGLHDSTHPFFKALLAHIADELKQKSFQTEEHWKVLGAKPTEGHTGLIEKCLIQAEMTGTCTADYESYGSCVSTLIDIMDGQLQKKE
ncbi:MAG: hypothetical protein HQK92_09530 [Nitrospirae bacterium]|nr:hypothetical protein [Nitrospirota bacterium]